MKRHLHNTSYLFVLVILAAGLFVRWYRLSELMPFIGDQGWFYLSARDLILHHTIPLVGITSSHTWLHQGPYWTYLLAVIFAFMKFNPLAPGYVTTFLDGLTILLIYILGRNFFSEKVGLIASMLYAFSPLVIVTSRMPYHTSLISLMTTLFLFASFQWIRYGSKYFPLVVVMLSVLYNFELATSIYWIVILLVLLYGFWKKSSYIQHIFAKETILISLLSFISLMFPILLYDFTHGMKQTVVFAGWTIYQIVSVPMHILSHQPSHVNMSGYITTFLQRLLFLPNTIIALLLFLFVLIAFTSILFQKKTEEKMMYVMLGICFIIPFLGVVAGGTPSDAYLPMLFPGLLLITAVTISIVVRNYLAISIILLVLVSLNTRSLLSQNYLMGVQGGYGPYFSERVRTVHQILSDADHSSYTIKGIGPGSQFASFTMNYTFLAWYLGHTPVSNGQKTFSLYETPSQVIVTK